MQGPFFFLRTVAVEMSRDFGQEILRFSRAAKRGGGGFTPGGASRRKRAEYGFGEYGFKHRTQ